MGQDRHSAKAIPRYADRTGGKGATGDAGLLDRFFFMNRYGKLFKTVAQSPKKRIFPF
jgi:hypothetical protein